MSDRNFFSELKRRNVYRVVIAYIVAAWALSQGVAQIFPVFDVPNWAVRLVILLIIAGFPVAAISAWFYELTPEGLKKTEDVPLSQSIRRSTGRKLDFLIIFVLAATVGLLLCQRWRAPSRGTGEQESPSKSIAVLPFENLSSDRENAYFADGIQDEILTKLASVADLKVISRISTAKYKSK